MEERYWLRHPALNGHLGPYTGDQVRKAIETGAFPRDSYVLVDSGQTETDRMASTYWRPANVVLGSEPPPPSIDQPAKVQRALTRLELRDRLRQDSAYGAARGLITFLAVVTLLVSLLIAVVSIGRDGGQLILIASLQALAAITLAAFLQGMLDIADSNLRQQR